MSSARKSGASPPRWVSYSESLRALRHLLQIEQHRQTRSRLKGYCPYPRQAEFHAAGSVNRERLFMAGNQLGKTLAGGSEWAFHLTGRYPDWWVGRTFAKPTRLWCAGVTAESTRDNPQRILIGPPAQAELWGTGTIPGDAVVACTPARGVANLIDTVVVRHGGGGDVQCAFSTLGFKSYEKGREKWQGETLDGVWFDEEPPLDIYMEGLTRTNATGGITIVTFTPLHGMSEVVMLFLTEDQLKGMRRDTPQPVAPSDVGDEDEES
jgi:phage terminase large subunit-like protein